jgi:hypothetical protein
MIRIKIRIKQNRRIAYLFIGIITTIIFGCASEIKVKSGPLVTDIFTADPSAHVFENKLYIYPSHDIDTGVPDSHEGDQFDMKDYHVFSLENINEPVKDYGEVLNLDGIPWAKKQLWAPDAAYKNKTYYFYFPAKDKDGIFRIGVATGNSPAGPFVAEPEPIPGSFSIDPCVFIDDDGIAYMYFGGLWGGQLERWTEGHYDPDGKEPSISEPALGPRVAVMTHDMLGFEKSPREIKILDEKGNPVLTGERNKKFFEASWVYKYNGYYYFSYSTGVDRRIAYAIGKDPLGPFTFKGYVLGPVSGWTTHHSIVKYKSRWYLFYHDCSIAPQGKVHLRCIKMAELHYDNEGAIIMIDPDNL